MRAEFTSDNRGFPHGDFPSITPCWPNGSEERYDWLTERSKRGECQKYVLCSCCLLARQRFQDGVTCLSFQTQDGTLETSSDRLLFRYSI
jgi:hypothetical protein